jgi:TRAP-type C4-dicarboxylate transport system permease small subunit
MLAFVPLAIVLDVSMRALGEIPPQWTSAVVEYLNLYMPLLAAPWILERRGHVVVGIFVGALPAKYGFVMDQIVILLCIAISAIFGVISLQLLWEAFVSGAGDMRSITVPRWLLFVPVAVSFLSFIPILIFFFTARLSLREGQSHSGH